MSEVVNAAHNDGQNQVFSILGVIGSLGTSDVKGTALTLPIGVNPDTGAMLVDVTDAEFNVGTLTVGTINKIGTVSEVTSGSITVVGGTINTGTISIKDAPVASNNSSFVLTRNASGYVGTIVMTLATTNYTRTLTRDTANYIGTISAWA